VSLTWDPSGRLLVADSIGGCLFAFSTDGAYLGQLGVGVLQRPAGIAVDPKSRRIFVADVTAHQVLILGPEGQLIQRLGQRGNALGQFNFPTNLALDAKGRLYVSDSLNFRVQQFSPDLAPLLQIGHQGDVPGTFSQPKGLGIDPEGHVYVIDSRFENVQIFDDQAQLLLAFGEEGAGPGQFWLPAGVHIDTRGRIWVADTYNRRIAVFDYISRPDPTAAPATPASQPARNRGGTPAVRPFESLTRPTPEVRP
jgi:DNA-binding beta-propeller fold protein YncE